MRLAPDELNREAWSGAGTLRWFSHYEGWSDPGERMAIETVAQEARGAAILDIGVGAGRTTPILRALSSDYTAIDFSPAMVALCREKYPDVEVRAGDARDLSEFGATTFGLVVFSWNGIDAVSHGDRDLVFREVHRVLKPGGLFVFSSHNKAGPGHHETPWRLRRSELRHPRHLLKRVASLPIDVRNYRRNSALNHDAGEWSMMNAAAHHFGIVIHYTTLQRQLTEIEQHGFARDSLVFESGEGARVTPDDDTSRAWWFHFVARKPADVQR